MYPITQIQAVLQARLKGPAFGSIQYLGTDSRHLPFASQTLFVALQGPQRNGHTYLSQAYQQGVRHFLVSEEAVAQQLPADACFLQVPNTLQALQQLAAWHRQHFACAVVGITGSNGKTVVKEWLATLVQSLGPIVRSPRSYNSQMGVPLSVWAMQPTHNLGIFEAGISQPQEMEALAAIIAPTHGLFTNLGAAHDAGFKSRQQKWEEKLKLFTTAHTVLLRHEDVAQYERPAWIPPTQQWYTWGSQPGAHFTLVQQQVVGHQTVITLRMQHQQHSFTLPFTAQIHIENAIAATCMALLLGATPFSIQQQLPQLQGLDMRLELAKGINGSTLINDSYSNDLVSLQKALAYLRQQSHGTAIVILGPLEQQASPQSYLPQLAALLAQQPLAHVWLVGQPYQGQQSLFTSPGRQVRVFEQVQQVLQALPQLPLAGSTLLIKGPRSSQLEQVAARLRLQNHQTRLVIDLEAMATNLATYRSALAPGTRIMVMLKAFGYGSGDAEVGRLLQHAGVHYLAVAYADEGVALRRAGITLPILVLNPEAESFTAMEAHNLEPELFSPQILQAFGNYCQQQGISAWPVHLKLDTGMHRLGFLPQEVPEILALLQHYPMLRVQTVFTHLVAAEEAAADDFTAHQLAAFAQACKQLQAGLGYSFLRHAANTAAISRHPHAHFDMVRLGIGLYGGAPGTQPVLQWLTTVAQVKEEPAGHTVGYGRQAVLQRPSTIATVRLGYADGYRRQLGMGVGHMYVRGARVPIVGRVCMDMTMLDVTDVPGVQPGDTVEVMGPHIPLQQLAAWCQTIHYEIMTGISARVHRVYVQG